LREPEKLDNAHAFLFQVATTLATNQLRRRQLHYRHINAEKGLTQDDIPPDPNASGASPEQVHAKGFRAPSLNELYEGTTEDQAFLTDPCTLLQTASSLAGCAQLADATRNQFLTVSPME